MAFFDYDKYKGTSKKLEDKKSNGFFDYDKYTQPTEPVLRTDPISNEIRMRPMKFIDNIRETGARKREEQRKVKRLTRMEENSLDPDSKLVERPAYMERVREETNKAPKFLQPLVFPMAAIAEAPAVRAIGESLGTVKPEEEGYLPVSGAGKVAGQIIAPIGAALTTPGAQLGGGALYSKTGDMLTRLAPRLGNTGLGRTAETATKLGTEGAITGVGAELAINPNATGKELLESAAYGGGGTAILGGLGKGAGEGVKWVVKTLREALAGGQRDQINAVVRAITVDNPTLALPERSVVPEVQRGNLNRAVTPDIVYGEGKVKQFALPAPNIDAPTIGRIERQGNPYLAKLENLFATAKQMDLPPGREYEYLHDLWSRMASREDPGLDELIDLASQTRPNRVTPDLVQRARTSQAKRDKYGVPLPAKTLSERYKGGVLAQAEAPIQQPIRIPSDEQLARARGEIKPEATTARTGPVRLAELSQETPPTVPVVEPVRPTTQPKPEQQRGFATTLLESDKPPQGFKERLKSAYTPITNEQTLTQANKRINKDVEEAASFVLGNSRFTAEKATVAQRLIDHYNAQGDFQRAVDVAEKVSEEATRAGQSIQALSMFNKLSPEGVLIFAQRTARKVNEGSTIFSKEAKVTPEMAQNITGLAQAAQKMTGVKDLSNNVMDILEKAKAGGKLTETEAEMLKRFVTESKQFVKETSKPPKPPRPPQKPKDERVLSNVTKFLDAQEQAAKERLRARGIRISSTPLDVWADYAVIGAAKMAKGTIKFAEWSEQMVKELGEEIRPHLQNLYNRSREAFEVSTKKITSQTISDAERITERVMKAKELPPGDAVTLRRLAQNVSRLSGEEKRIASQDLQLILQTLERPGILRKVSTVQTIGQLLNPKTQVRNSLGNELFYRIERLNKYLATPIDIVRSKITGGQRTVTFKTNAQGQFWRNWMIGLKAGWKGVNVNGLETQYDLSGLSFRNKYNPVRYLEKALGASLKSFDTAAYMRAHNKTVGELATLRAINEGQGRNKALIQKYILESDDNVMKLADEYGRYVTFQDNNLISQGLVKLKRGLNLGKDWGAGDLILKYPKTPGALLHRALEYSPAGFLRSAAILARPIFKKEPNTKEVTEALSRAIIGTLGLSGMGYALADLGIITGAASKDKDIRDLQRSAGQGQYQVNVSALMRFVKSGFKREAAKLREDDFLYSYDWMQPVSIAASIGANVKKNLSEGKGITSDLGSTAYNSIEGGLGTLTEQSVLGGVKRAVEGYPGQTVTDKIVDILSDIPASFVPTFSNQIKQIGDNARRETYSPDKLESSLNRAKTKIPGLAEKLPKQYDTLGREKETYQNNSLFNVMFNPGFSSRYTLSPEAKFIVDLINETGDESLAPRVPSKSITIDGQSVKLNGDMFSRFQQLQGEETRKRIAKINPQASLKSRIKRTETALKDAGDKARKTLKKEMGNLR